ncbi:N-terminal nucleophile aminohydrolase [Pleurostoma richardsiae]|uniref:N-terminal nucleophile aminohydrolase n=1 Tax=Pleurostoma richardsiae TaxID=41990 RepID=A0AA38VID2_9PEZI|nr:N-terminal nucleophile aminohydrolase [Pleurostoma richardsiae]
MEYKPQPASHPAITPRIIIHGGAGNIQPADLAPDRYREYRAALLSIITKTDSFMHAPVKHRQHPSSSSSSSPPLPTALETATHALSLLEDNPLFNAGKGAVFTRDGINELEASVMVSRGFAKRGVGVLGLRRVRNPVLLARAILEHGDADLAARPPPAASEKEQQEEEASGRRGAGLDVPSAQGHTLLHGPTAEALAARYGLPLVEPSYFFTQRRWDEHVRGLDREREGGGTVGAATASWSPDEYLPQGTCGAVALDSEGAVCAATSTGGLTNKLTGRLGDTPVLGAGFWAEEWAEEGDPTGWERTAEHLRRPGAAIELAGALRGMMADCLPTPFLYAPVAQRARGATTTTTRSLAVSGTGNGDSFLRVAAAHTVVAIARFKPASSAEALAQVAGPGGELQRSAGSRWRKTGEGEGGLIGIESVVVRDAEGNVMEKRHEVLQNYNCGGMFRAWIDEEGKAVVRIWRDE